MSTPHAATAYPVESTSPYGPPADTAASEEANLAALRVDLDRDEKSTHAQYRLLTGVPDPGEGQPDNQNIPTVPSMSWTKIEIVTWLLDNGVTLGEPALSNLNKSELLDLVELEGTEKKKPAELYQEWSSISSRTKGGWPG